MTFRQGSLELKGNDIENKWRKIYIKRLLIVIIGKKEFMFWIF